MQDCYPALRGTSVNCASRTLQRSAKGIAAGTQPGKWHGNMPGAQEMGPLGPLGPQGPQEGGGSMG